MGIPPNITKPYRPTDLVCPPRDPSSSYKLIKTENDGTDIGENLIEDGEKGKAIRSNPSTFSLELSSGSHQNSFSLMLVAVFSSTSLIWHLSLLLKHEN